VLGVGAEKWIPDAAPGLTGMLLGMQESYKKGDGMNVPAPQR
jgi:hypothetical protein